MRPARGRHTLDSAHVSAPGTGAASPSAAPGPAGGSDGTGRVSREQVAALASLARLEVTDDELALFAGQLEVILGAVARVGEVAAPDVPGTSHAVPLVNVLRDDVVAPSLPREAALAGAPDVEDDRFRVPRIVGEQA